MISVFCNDRSFNITHEKMGPLHPFELSNQTLEQMEQPGVFQVSKLLEKPYVGLTNFDHVLLRGIHWFANSQTQTEIENKFLSLITCLEAFLTPRDGNPIGTAIAEGVALILTTELKDRKSLKKKVKDLYAKRNKVSHGGHKAIFEADLNTLTQIACSFTRRMIEMRDQFSSQKSLLEWIDDQKLG